MHKTLFSLNASDKGLGRFLFFKSQKTFVLNLYCRNNSARQQLKKC